MVGLRPPDFDRPSGRGLSASLPRHFVPGYDHPVLRTKAIRPSTGTLRLPIAQPHGNRLRRNNIVARIVSRSKANFAPIALNSSGTLLEFPRVKADRYWRKVC